MKKQLLVAAVAALVAGNVYADEGASLTKGEARTEIFNNTPTDIWVHWYAVTLRGKARQFAGRITGIKDEYIRIDAKSSYTMVHSRDGIKVRTYVCENNTPVRKEIEHDMKFKGYERIDVDLNSRGDIEITESVRAGRKGVKPEDVAKKK